MNEHDAVSSLETSSSSSSSLLPSSSSTSSTTSLIGIVINVNNIVRVAPQLLCIAGVSSLVLLRAYLRSQALLVQLQEAATRVRQMTKNLIVSLSEEDQKLIMKTAKQLKEDGGGVVDDEGVEKINSAQKEKLPPSQSPVTLNLFSASGKKSQIPLNKLMSLLSPRADDEDDDETTKLDAPVLLNNSNHDSNYFRSPCREKNNVDATAASNDATAASSDATAVGDDATAVGDDAEDGKNQPKKRRQKTPTTTPVKGKEESFGIGGDKIVFKGGLTSLAASSSAQDRNLDKLATEVESLVTSWRRIEMLSMKKNPVVVAAAKTSVGGSSYSEEEKEEEIRQSFFPVLHDSVVLVFALSIAALDQCAAVSHRGISGSRHTKFTTLSSSPSSSQRHFQTAARLLWQRRSEWLLQIVTSVEETLACASEEDTDENNKNKKKDCVLLKQWNLSLDRYLHHFEQQKTVKEQEDEEETKENGGSGIIATMEQTATTNNEPMLVLAEPPMVMDNTSSEIASSTTTITTAGFVDLLCLLCRRVSAPVTFAIVASQMMSKVDQIVNSESGGTPTSSRNNNNKQNSTNGRSSKNKDGSKSNSSASSSKGRRAGGRSDSWPNKPSTALQDVEKDLEANDDEEDIFSGISAKVKSATGPPWLALLRSGSIRILRRLCGTVFSSVATAATQLAELSLSHSLVSATLRRVAAAEIVDLLRWRHRQYLRMEEYQNSCSSFSSSSSFSKSSGHVLNPFQAPFAAVSGVSKAITSFVDVLDAVFHEGLYKYWSVLVVFTQYHRYRWSPGCLSSSTSSSSGALLQSLIVSSNTTAAPLTPDAIWLQFVLATFMVAGVTAFKKALSSVLAVLLRDISLHWEALHPFTEVKNFLSLPLFSSSALSSSLSSVSPAKVFADHDRFQMVRAAGGGLDVTAMTEAATVFNNKEATKQQNLGVVIQDTGLPRQVLKQLSEPLKKFAAIFRKKSSADMAIVFQKMKSGSFNHTSSSSSSGSSSSNNKPSSQTTKLCRNASDTLKSVIEQKAKSFTKKHLVGAWLGRQRCPQGGSLSSSQLNAMMDDVRKIEVEMNGEEEEGGAGTFSDEAMLEFTSKGRQAGQLLDAALAVPGPQEEGSKPLLANSTAPRTLATLKNEECSVQRDEEEKKKDDHVPRASTPLESNDIGDDCENTEKSANKKGFSIEFSHVWFRYPSIPQKRSPTEEKGNKKLSESQQQSEAQEVEDDWALQDVSFVIPAGSFVGIIGESGSGKSTLLHLLLGLYPPTRGHIFIDGVDITKLQKRRYRRRIALVAQRPGVYEGSLCKGHRTSGFSPSSAGFLYGATVADAVWLGNITAPKEALSQALALADVLHVVQSKPKGIETAWATAPTSSSNSNRRKGGSGNKAQRGPTPIPQSSKASATRHGNASSSSNGSALPFSGGEVQRISLARSFMRLLIRDNQLGGAHLCLLDEATSALDVETESVIQERILRGDGAGGWCTTVAVAHRLATLKTADRVIALGPGGTVVMVADNVQDAALAAFGSDAVPPTSSNATPHITPPLTANSPTITNSISIEQPMLPTVPPPSDGEATMAARLRKCEQVAQAIARVKALMNPAP